MSKEKIVECVPNFSEGRDLVIIDKIVDCFRGRKSLKLLDYSNDIYHNRMVVTIVGEIESVKDSIINAVGAAISLIDLNKHEGEHPRIGAADVIPFIPISNLSMDEAVTLSKEVASEVASRFGLPVYLYEISASAPHRQNLADVRKGQFEGLVSKMKDPLWKPDFGPSVPHPTAGAAVIGARNYLIAYNINLNSDDIQIAKAIARKVRFSSGGLPCCKAMGVTIGNGSQVQVSMNLTDFNTTSMFKVFEAVKSEAELLGVSIDCSELIGMVPLKAITDVAAESLLLKDFSPERIIENRLSE
jgi:glutamate formiminotransferase / 5-formyltetrahydrofolate cyclo-ligase